MPSYCTYIHCTYCQVYLWSSASRHTVPKDYRASCTYTCEVSTSDLLYFLIYRLMKKVLFIITHSPPSHPVTVPITVPTYTVPIVNCACGHQPPAVLCLHPKFQIQICCSSWYIAWRNNARFPPFRCRFFVAVSPFCSHCKIPLFRKTYVRKFRSVTAVNSKKIRDGSGNGNGVRKRQRLTGTSNGQWKNGNGMMEIGHNAVSIITQPVS